MSDPSYNPTVHATCLVIDGKGILIRGRSGAGKSNLALALLRDATTKGRFARLVADDRVYLDVLEGHLIARVPATIAGLVEQRGVGIVRVDHIEEAEVRLVVDILESGAQTRHGVADVRGVRLPQIAVGRLVEPRTDEVFAVLEAA